MDGLRDFIGRVIMPALSRHSQCITPPASSDIHNLFPKYILHAHHRSIVKVKEYTVESTDPAKDIDLFGGDWILPVHLLGLSHTKYSDESRTIVTF
eukprot:scaffold288975_cov39-Prasinocladus_malaysianus.AAC.1